MHYSYIVYLNNFIDKFIKSNGQVMYKHRLLTCYLDVAIQMQMFKTLTLIPCSLLKDFIVQSLSKCTHNW